MEKLSTEEINEKSNKDAEITKDDGSDSENSDTGLTGPSENEKYEAIMNFSAMTETENP